MVDTLTATTVDREVEARARTRPAIIDCDVHNELDSIKDLYPYLSKRWRDHLDAFGVRHPNSGYYPRFMDNREDARPPSGRRSGSEVGVLRDRYLEPYNVAFAILNPLSPAPVTLDLELGSALATAVNDWQVAEWLDREPRLRASIVIQNEHPAAAAEEVRRRARDRRFVQVLFMGRTQEPMGRRKYWPIYEACAEHGLHLASHAFGAYGHPITGAGHASFYIEDHTSPPQAVQANITSLVVEGVFDRFPCLRFVSVENGFGWLPALLWRLDAAWGLLRAEVPHLERRPSEIVRERVWLSTQPIEEPHRPEQMLELLDHFGEMRDHLMLASDYPHWDGDNPDVALPSQLPEEWKRRIRFDNARELYGL
ncbi:MAG TPA: amidohydrolase family protein [Thermoanaerobaculia bacterium]|nr:amidohydrolase family protein [Thermoanaerobaculia bacterium]